MSSNNNQNSKKNEITSIRFGIIIQNSSLVKIDELFESYFQKSNPIVIKKEKIEYEFSPNENKELRLIFNILTDDVMKNIQQIYSSFNFYIIFMDIQNSSALKNLEKDINKLISCSDDILTKFYIFGVFQEEDLIVIKDEKISTILNCKGIDFEYSELNINSIEDFPKGMEYIIDETKEFLEEQKSQEKIDKMEEGKQKSCNIF